MSQDRLPQFKWRFLSRSPNAKTCFFEASSKNCVIQLGYLDAGRYELTALSQTTSRSDKIFTEGVVDEVVGRVSEASAFACIRQDRRTRPSVLWSGAHDHKSYVALLQEAFGKGDAFDIYVPCDADICREMLQTFQMDEDGKQACQEVIEMMRQTPDVESKKVACNFEVRNVAKHGEYRYINLTPLHQDGRDARTLPSPFVSQTTLCLNHIQLRGVKVSTSPRLVEALPDANIVLECTRLGRRNPLLVGQARKPYSCIMLPFGDLVYKDPSALAARYSKKGIEMPACLNVEDGDGEARFADLLHRLSALEYHEQTYTQPYRKFAMVPARDWYYLVRKDLVDEYYMPYQHTSGLRWKEVSGIPASAKVWVNVGQEKPPVGKELTDEGLRNSLRTLDSRSSRRSKELWTSLPDTNLLNTDFIKVDRSYYSPKVNEYYFRITNSDLDLQAALLRGETEFATTQFDIPQLRTSHFISNGSRHFRPVADESYFRFRKIKNINVATIDDKYKKTANDETWVSDAGIRNHLESQHPDINLSMSASWLVYDSTAKSRLYLYRDEESWHQFEESRIRKSQRKSQSNVEKWFYKDHDHRNFTYEYYADAANVLSSQVDVDLPSNIEGVDDGIIKPEHLVISKDSYVPDDAFLLELYENHTLVSYRLILQRHALACLFKSTQSKYVYSIVACDKASDGQRAGVALDDNLRSRGVRIDWAGAPSDIMDDVCSQLSTHHGVPIYSMATNDVFDDGDDLDLSPTYFPASIVSCASQPADPTDGADEAVSFSDPPALVTTVSYTIIHATVRGHMCNLVFENGDVLTLPRRVAFRHIGETLAEGEALRPDDVSANVVANVTIDDPELPTASTNDWIECQGRTATSGRAWDGHAQRSTPWTADMTVRDGGRHLLNCSWHTRDYTPKTDSYVADINIPFSVPKDVRYLYLRVSSNPLYLILENRRVAAAPMLGVICKGDKVIRIKGGVLELDGVVRPCRWGRVPEDLEGKIVSVHDRIVDGKVIVNDGESNRTIPNPTPHYRAPAHTVMAMYEALVRATSVQTLGA